MRHPDDLLTGAKSEQYLGGAGQEADDAHEKEKTARWAVFPSRICVR
ncbi:MAG: hypothetical protein JO293_03995 [Candidatus Eremiobacteraeota bacterium]|nr:hypothetical protein [Candidatus Eremiobacteraeota bacterium]